MSWIALFFGIVFNAVANILIKAGVSRIGEAESLSFFSQALGQPLLYAGVTAFMVALGAYSFALSRLDLSIAYPLMTSLGLVIVALASMLLFDESYGAVKIAGTLLIMLGVVLLTRAA